MDEKEVEEKIFHLSQGQALQEKIVNELIQHMIDLDLDDFESVLDNYIMTRGIDKTITHIIFPFLDRIGILWQTNHIQPTQEHLVTNIIRQKLIVGIEGVITHITSDKTVLLFLPEGEHHELGLLYVYYLLKNRGIRILYIGSNVPVKDIEYICQAKKPDYLYTHLTCVTGNFNFEKFLQFMQQHLPDYPLCISGKLAQAQIRKIPASVSFRKSLHEVLDFVASL
jgi:methanogenic corrinoid protein MtbC1